MTQNRKKFINLISLSAGCWASPLASKSFMEAQDKKIKAIFFFLFLVIKTLDPDWIPIRIHLKCWIRIRIQ
jgi:hypothetical protein